MCCHYSSFITACFCPLPSGLWQQHRHIVTIDIRRKPIETLLTSYSVGKADRRDEEQEEECVCIGSLLFFLSCTHENERGKQGKKRGGDFIPLLLLRRKEKGRGRGGGGNLISTFRRSLSSLSLWSRPDVSKAYLSCTALLMLLLCRLDSFLFHLSMLTPICCGRPWGIRNMLLFPFFPTQLELLLETERGGDCVLASASLRQSILCAIWSSFLSSKSSSRASFLVSQAHSNP